MDETAIADKLRASIHKEEERIAPPKMETAEEFDASGLYASDIDAFELIQHFKLPRLAYSDRSVVDRLNSIYGMVSAELGTKDSADVRLYIRKVEQKLGVTHRDDDKIAAIYQYLKLHRQKKQIDKELKLI